MVLVTCANGKTGHAIIRELLKLDIPLRALTASENSSRTLSEIGVSDIIVGDLRNYDDIKKACIDIKSVYFITPNFSPDEEIITSNLLDICSKSRVRVVLHSVIHPQIHRMTHHWSRLKVESQLIESDLDWVILQPTTYMQNILPQLPIISENKELKLPVPVDQKLSVVDLNDIAEVAVKAINDKTFNHGIFELCGESISLFQQAKVISEVLGLPISAKTIDIDIAINELGVPFVGNYGLEAIRQMWSYYAAHGLAGNNKILSSILGRKPTSYLDFAKAALK